MVEIRDRDALEAWLEGRAREDVVTLATRSTLRTLPLISDIFEVQFKQPTEICVLPIFRALIVAHLSTKLLSESAKPSNRAYALLDRACHAAEGSGADDAASTAIATTKLSVALVQSLDSLSDGRRTDATAAAESINIANLWKYVSEDITKLLDGSTFSDINISPLWNTDQPFWARSRWKDFTSALRDADGQDWDFWINWYEARVRGEPGNEALERAIVLIDDDVWEQGPGVVNAEIRRLVAVHRPTRAQLEDTVSPQPVIEGGKLDVQPNEKYDAPDGSEDLATLPTRQRDVIAVLMLGADRAQVTPEVSFALKIYDNELLASGTHPALGTLTDMHAIVWGEYNTLKREKFFNGEGALKNSFDVFNANHKLLISHFPLDAKREAMLRERPVDRTALDIGEIRSLADQFTQSVELVAAQGFATADFVTVSLRIANDLKSATYVVPPAPTEQMGTNRTLMEAHEFSAADRAVIKAMTFTDSLRHLLEKPEASPEARKTAHDAGLNVSTNLIANAIWKALGG